MNCLLWVPRFWPATGGTEFHSHRLAHCLANAGHQATVITHCDEMDSPLARGTALCRSTTYNDGDVVIHRLGLDGVVNSLEDAAAQLHQQIRLTRPVFRWLLHKRLRPRALEIATHADLVHFIYNGLTESVELAADVAELAQIPFIFTPNVLNTRDRQSAWTTRRFVQLYQRASKIVALTDHEAQWLTEHGADADRITVIPYGPILEPESNGNRFRKKLGIGDEPLVLFLGRLTDTKGYDLLLGARKKIWQEFPQCQIVFIGPPTEFARGRIKLIRDKRIHLLESVDQQGKADALAACDIFCLPSREESLGGVYIEAAKLGKPSIALDIPVLHHLIQPRYNGLLVPHSPMSLAQGIVDMLQDEKWRLEMGRNAQAQAMERFTWETVTAQMLALYFGVVN